MKRQEHRDEQHADDGGDDRERDANPDEIAEHISAGADHEHVHGEEIGVMKAEDAASATIIANG